MIEVKETPKVVPYVFGSKLNPEVKPFTFGAGTVGGKTGVSAGMAQGSSFAVTTSAARPFGMGSSFRSTAQRKLSPPKPVQQPAPAPKPVQQSPPAKPIESNSTNRDEIVDVAEEAEVEDEEMEEEVVVEEEARGQSRRETALQALKASRFSYLKRNGIDVRKGPVSPKHTRNKKYF